MSQLTTFGFFFSFTSSTGNNGLMDHEIYCITLCRLDNIKNGNNKPWPYRPISSDSDSTNEECRLANNDGHIRGRLQIEIGLWPAEIRRVFVFRKICKIIRFPVCSRRSSPGWRVVKVFSRAMVMMETFQK